MGFPMTVPRLQLSRITRRYPGVVANADVDLVVQPGEIHAVLGENGAGKSTPDEDHLRRCAAGCGSVRFDGQEVRIDSPQAARALGIAMVFSISACSVRSRWPRTCGWGWIAP